MRAHESRPFWTPCCPTACQLGMRRPFDLGLSLPWPLTINHLITLIPIITIWSADFTIPFYRWENRGTRRSCSYYAVAWGLCSDLSDPRVQANADTVAFREWLVGKEAAASLWGKIQVEAQLRYPACRLLTHSQLHQADWASLVGWLGKDYSPTLHRATGPAAWGEDVLAAKYSGGPSRKRAQIPHPCWQGGRGPQGLTRRGSHSLSALSKALESTGREQHVALG